MWSNVEVYSQMATHTWPGGVGKKGRHRQGDGTCTVGSWGRQARTQVNRCQHSSCTASYVLTCRLGLVCTGNTGCYTVQCMGTAGTRTDWSKV